MKYSLILLFFIFLGGCSPKVETQIEKDLVLHCVKKNMGNPSQCHCLYEKLEEHYGAEILKNSREKKALPEGLHETMRTAIPACWKS